MLRHEFFLGGFPTILPTSTLACPPPPGLLAQYCSTGPVQIENDLPVSPANPTAGATTGQKENVTVSEF